MKEFQDEDYEALATRSRIALGIDEELHFDPMAALEAAKRVGLIADYVTLPDSVMEDGVRGHYDPDKRTIYLSQNTRDGCKHMVPRDVYTVAHELSHRLLNHERPRNRSATLSKIERIHPQTRIENRAAERLAASLLAPFHKSNFSPQTSVAELATRFNLSAAMAAIRLGELALIYRRRNGIERDAPEVVVNYLAEARKRGRDVRGGPIPTRTRSVAVGNRTSVALAAPHYVDNACPKCGNRTLLSIGVKYLCDTPTCHYLGELTDGD